MVSLFESMAASFATGKVILYGKGRKFVITAKTSALGDKWYQDLRFVLMWLKGTRIILVSADLTQAPAAIMEVYCHLLRLNVLSVNSSR